jgi:Zn finger protein HypA/HybF involved in hydrogenase expression
LKPEGSNPKTLKKKLEEFNIDYSHFTGQGWNQGLKFKPNPAKDLKDIMVKNSTYQSYKLLHRMIKEGIKVWKCEKCGNTEWNGNPIPLELHHIDGDNTNHTLENLQILCPNCHAQTDNFRGKKNKKPNLSAQEETLEVEAG